MASLITQPADVVKTNVQVNPQLKTAEAIRCIYMVTVTPLSLHGSTVRLKIKPDLLLSLSFPGTWTAGLLQRGGTTGAEEDDDGRHGVDGVRADDGTCRTEVLKERSGCL